MDSTARAAHCAQRSATSCSTAGWTFTGAAPPAGRTNRTRAAWGGGRCATWRSVSCARRGRRTAPSCVRCYSRSTGTPTISPIGWHRCARSSTPSGWTNRPERKRSPTSMPAGRRRSSSSINGFRCKRRAPEPARWRASRRSNVTPTSTAGIRIDCARLYGAFAGQNPVSFHARDGSGYRFLAERVARIDRANPQIAARLLAPLTRWRRYDAGRRAAMKDALRGIESSDAISRDVYEVVTKTLQGEG